MLSEDYRARVDSWESACQTKDIRSEDPEAGLQGWGVVVGLGEEGGGSHRGEKSYPCFRTIGGVTQPQERAGRGGTSEGS